ncbi:uncharacterized protein BKA78DRAFT_318531 [Phyllosticta capitalensis]
MRDVTCPTRQLIYWQPPHPGEPSLLQTTPTSRILSSNARPISSSTSNPASLKRTQLLSDKMPISAGTKVSDPNAVKSEGAGIVTNDSLAAESAKGSGAFGAGNSKAGVHEQPSSGTTTNNTNISGASVLGAASTAEAREAEAEWSETAQLNAGRSLGKEGGVGPTYNTTGATGGAAESAGAAPTYANVDLYNEGGKPKGKNLTEEEGFTGSEANASFNSEIGSKNDPGRAAEQKFQRNAVQSAQDSATGPRQQNIDPKNDFSVLGGETSA